MPTLTSCPNCRIPIQGQAGFCPDCGCLVNGTAWFVAKNRQKIGPISFGQLQEMAATSQLQPSDMIVQDGTKQWLKASSIADLFPAEAAPGVPLVSTAVNAPGPGPDATQSTVANVLDPDPFATVEPEVSAPQPTPSRVEKIGRYRVVKVLGEGASQPRRLTRSASWWAINQLRRL